MGSVFGTIYNQFPGQYYWVGGTSFYSSKGDSILNGYTYIKVYATDERGEIVYNKPDLIRQDEEKVYYWLDSPGTDTLLYDFSLQPGDTAKVYTLASLGVFGTNPVVDSVGEITLGNEVRKCIYFNTDGGFGAFVLLSNEVHQLMWIEGIGSNDGLFFTYNGAYIIDGVSFLTCFKENDTIKYGIENCNLTYVNIDDSKQINSFDIFSKSIDGKTLHFTSTINYISNKNYHFQYFRERNPTN